jgi:hypothetical protein
MSVLDDQKHKIEGQINALFTDVIMNYNVPEEITLQYLFQLKDKLIPVLKTALQLHKRANDFNATQTNDRYKIKIGTLGRSLDMIKVKFMMIRDIFSKQLKEQPQTLTQSQASKMNEFLESDIVTEFVGNAKLVPQTPLPIRHSRTPSEARSRPSQVGSPIRHSRPPQVVSPVRHSQSPSVARPHPVVSPANVIVNHESPQTEQHGCFGRMCDSLKSLKSRFSKNRVHPDHGRSGGKRKLRRRTRRTRRSRGRRSRLK